MLTITIKDGEIVRIGDVTVVARLKFNRRMSLSVEAPRELRIERMAVGKTGELSAVETMTAPAAAPAPRGARSWGITGRPHDHALNSADD